MRYFLYCFGLPFNTTKFEISNNYMVGQTMKTHSESIETLIDTITETPNGRYDFDSEKIIHVDKAIPSALKPFIPNSFKQVDENSHTRWPTVVTNYEI